MLVRPAPIYQRYCGNLKENFAEFMHRKELRSYHDNPYKDYEHDVGKLTLGYDFFPSDSVVKIQSVGIRLTSNPASGEWIEVTANIIKSNYSEFMEFRRNHNFNGSAFMSGYGGGAFTDEKWNNLPLQFRQNPITLHLTSGKLREHPLAEEFINKLHAYAQLPDEVYQQLRLACDLPPIRNLMLVKENILQLIDSNKLDQAIAATQFSAFDLSDSIKPYCPSFSSLDNSELLFFVAQHFQNIAFKDFSHFPNLENSLKDIKDDAILQGYFQKAIDCYAAISPQSERYHDANLQIATLLDFYLKNASHTESESVALKKRVIEHAMKSGDCRFLYNLLSSYSGKQTTNCMLSADADMADLLILLAKEANNNIAQEPSPSSPRLFG